MRQTGAARDRETPSSRFLTVCAVPVRRRGPWPAALKHTWTRQQQDPQRAREWQLDGRLAAGLATLLLALASLGTPALAADDPPGRVGRVTEGQGQSWFYDTEAGEWVTLERNRPLTTATASRSTAPGASSCASVRPPCAWPVAASWRSAGSTTTASICSCTAAAPRCACDQPRWRAKSRWRPAQGRFSPRGAAHFRVDRRDDSSVATAWSGELQFEGDDSALTIPAGRSAELWREGAKNATHYAWGEPLRDDFADWTARANREDDRLAAPDYVSPEMTGCGRPRSQRPLGHAPRLRSDLDADHGGGGLGAVSLRPLGGRAALGLDMGRRRAVGLCAVPLRALVLLRRALVLVTGLPCGTAGLFAGHGGVGRRWRAREAPGRTSAGCRWRRANRTTRTTPAGGSYWRAVNSAQMNLFPPEHAAPPAHQSDAVFQPGRRRRGERRARQCAGATPPGGTGGRPGRPGGAQQLRQSTFCARARTAARCGQTHRGAGCRRARAPPRSPAQPPAQRPPGQPPSPAVMAQPGAPPAARARWAPRARSAHGAAASQRRAGQPCRRRGRRSRRQQAPGRRRRATQRRRRSRGSDCRRDPTRQRRCLRRRRGAAGPGGTDRRAATRAGGAAAGADSPEARRPG